MTPQYGHSLVGGIGGNDDLLFTTADLGTSVVDLAVEAATAVCRAVVAFVTGTGGGRVGPDFLLTVADFDTTLGAKCTAGLLSITLGS